MTCCQQQCKHGSLPLKKLIEARKAGASFKELRKQMLTWLPDTDALAGAFAENMEAGLRSVHRVYARGDIGDAEEIPEE